MAVVKSGKDKTQNYARVFVGGYDLSGDALAFSSADNSLDQIDVTGWSDAARKFKPGLRTVGVRGFQAIMNDAASRSFQVIKSGPNLLPMSLCFGGGGEPEIGDPSYQIPCQSFGEIVNISDGVSLIQCDWLSEPDTITALTDNPLGYVQYPATEISATLNADSINWEYDSYEGGWAVLHVLATASGDYAFKLQHSVNDSSWSDLLTFSIDGSAVNYEIKTVSGTISQYVRFVATKTAGTVTAVCTFARNRAEYTGILTLDEATVSVSGLALTVT